MNRKQKFALGEYYHLYNRGNNKSDIFRDDRDRDRFQLLLYLCNDNRPINTKELKRKIKYKDIFSIGREKLVEIGLYCLMPNHFHLLIKEVKENGTSCFMQKVLTAYSMYFNKKYERTGTLFEGKFKSKHISDDSHLKYLYSYIHLNPIKMIDPLWKERGLNDLISSKSFLNNYKYSSYLDYNGLTRYENSIISKESFPEYFTEVSDFQEFLEEWLNFSK